MPAEGSRKDSARIGRVARTDVPTCSIKEAISVVRDRVHHSGWDMAVAVSEEGVILGLLREEQLSAPADRTVEEVMQLGTSTWRPNLEIERMVRHAQRHQLHHLLVSTPDGKLLGALSRSDIERLAADIERSLERT